MVGEIHSWKMDEDMDMAVGAYYSVKNIICICGETIFLILTRE